MSRDAKEGVVVVSGDNKKTSVIEVNCETDFVAKNNDFVLFVKELSELNNNCSSNLEKLKLSNMKNNKSVEENLVSLIAKIGEKITIGKSITVSNENCINYIYQHSVVQDNVSKLAVITSLSASKKTEEIDLFGNNYQCILLLQIQ